jgi:hypothetical protein
MTRLQHVYEIRPHKDKRGVDLISDVLPFGRLWYGEPNAISNAINYATFFNSSHHTLIRVYAVIGASFFLDEKQTKVSLKEFLLSCYWFCLNRTRENSPSAFSKPQRRMNQKSQKIVIIII